MYQNSIHINKQAYEFLNLTLNTIILLIGPAVQSEKYKDVKIMKSLDRAKYTFFK